MTRGRLLGLFLVLQLLSVLLLTQTWFTIGMRLNGTLTQLGEFDGATSYNLAMPVSLFGIASYLVALLTKTKSKRFFLGGSSLAMSTLAIFLTGQVLNRNVSGLDPQLERLTGIAKTHGISDLTIQTSLMPWLWLTTTILAIACGVYAVVAREIWVSVPAAKSSGSRRNKPVSSIELWEQQRD